MADPLVAAGAIAGSAAMAAYLNAKLYLWKDLSPMIRAKRGVYKWRKAVERGEGSGFYLFQKRAQAYGDHLCIWSRHGVYSWREVYENVCRFGHYFLSLGVKPGDFVCVYLLNAPEMVFTWMGLLSIGAAPAQLNTNLSSDALVHCIKLAGGKLVVVDSHEACQERVRGSQERIETELGARVVVLDGTAKDEISRMSPEQPPKELIASRGDKAPYAIIYTSGTTGLPKGCALPMINTYTINCLDTKPYGRKPGPGGDRTYVCMPLYHGTGGLTAMSEMMNGTSLAIGRKFSLSNFWIDCIDSEATQFVYVGEVARYLLSAPPSPNDRKHKITWMTGNGLRGDVWGKFQERFGIKELTEFYASTENAFFSNNYYRSGNGFGAVGHHGVINRYLTKDTIASVQVDEETGNFVKNPATGFVTRKKLEEGGELIVKLPSENAWAQYFNNEEASKKKIARDVFEKGDIWLRTGDALRRDQDGFWYFMDRLGDNYRWKGENVSTTEVSAAFSTFPGVHEANVYGVALPHHDGRAGCAALVVDSKSYNSFPWEELTQHLRSKLPRYAVPVFVRFMGVTVGGMSGATNKQNKVALRNEGVDTQLYGTKVPGGELDKLFWLPPGGKSYVPFEPDDLKRLSAREVRL